MEHYKFEWKIIFLIAIVPALIISLVSFVLRLDIFEESIVSLIIIMIFSFLLGIFIPLGIGFTVAKKVSMHKVIQGGLAAFCYSIFSTFIGIIFSSFFILTGDLPMSDVISLLFALVPGLIYSFIYFGLGCLGAFIETLIYKTRPVTNVAETKPTTEVDIANTKSPAAESGKVCPYCGAPIKEEAFCPKCGHLLQK